MFYHGDGDIASGQTAVVKWIKGRDSIYLARFSLTPLGDTAAGQHVFMNHADAQMQLGSGTTDKHMMVLNMRGSIYKSLEKTLELTHPDVYFNNKRFGSKNDKDASRSRFSNNRFDGSENEHQSHFAKSRTVEAMAHIEQQQKHIHIHHPNV